MNAQSVTSYLTASLASALTDVTDAHTAAVCAVWSGNLAMHYCFLASCFKLALKSKWVFRSFLYPSFRVWAPIS